MCQRNAVTEKDNTIVGTVSFSPMSKDERLAEVDSRVAAKMALLEDRRNEYMRGFWDCFYILAFIGWGVYLFYYWKSEE